jgi:hypothetical protein
LIILACAGWQDALRKPEFIFVARRSFFAILSSVILSWIAVRQGYTSSDLLGPLTALLAALSAILIFSTAPLLLLPKHLPRLPYLVLVGLSSLIVVEAYSFYHIEQRTWRMGWDARAEKQILGSRLSHRKVTDRKPLSLARRPERIVIGTDHAEALKLQVSEAYNQCFYRPAFCALGYNNLRLSLPHVRYRQALAHPTDGPRLLGFIRQAQKLFILPQESVFDLAALSTQPDVEPIESLVPRVEGTVVGYGGEWARYRLSTPTSVRVVENEIWTSGWSVRLCQNGRCLAPQQSDHTSQYLRTWLVPAGDWDIEVFFEVHSERYAWLLFYAGLLAMMLAGLLGHHLGRSALVQAEA